MKINLDQKEIHQAISNYVSELGLRTNGKVLEIDFTAGRGANGLCADITITPTTDKSTEDKNPFEDNSLSANNNIGTEEDQPALDLDLDMKA